MSMYKQLIEVFSDRRLDKMTVRKTSVCSIAIYVDGCCIILEVSPRGYNNFYIRFLVDSLSGLVTSPVMPCGPV